MPRSAPIGKRLRPHAWLIAILTLSLALNLHGNRWGLPGRWHPDEITDGALSMVWSRTLNPGQLSYGGMHYFTIAGLAVAPAGIYARLFDPAPSVASDRPESRAWTERHSSRVTRLARTVSGVMGTLLVLVTYAIGTLLFSRSIGLTAALLLAVSPYLVVVAHFATTDMAANLWYWLACLCCVLVWKRGTLSMYLLAAALAGVAIGTKLDKAVVVVPFLTAHLLRWEGLHLKRLAGCAVVGLVSFALVNPWLIVSPFDFLDGTARELLFNTKRTPGPEGGGYALWHGLVAGMSWPVLIISLAGVLFAIVESARGCRRSETVLVLAMLLPFVFVYGLTTTPAWYIPVLLPGWAIFGAVAVVGLAGNVEGSRRRTVRAAAAGAAGFALVTSAIFDRQFSSDARYLAAFWIDENIPAGATVELGPRPPNLTRNKYVTDDRRLSPHWATTFEQWRTALDSDPKYIRLRADILELERRLAPKLGLAVRSRPYVAWFDRLPSVAVADPDSTQVTAPEFKVVVDYLERLVLDSLSRPSSGYRRLAGFRYADPLGIDPYFPFVNPEVVVFERVTPSPP